MYTFAQLQEMAQIMKAQEEKKRIPLTIRELEKLFDLQSTSAVTYRLNLMVQSGLVERIPRGKQSTYRTVI